ncbi:protein-S-isoprenylcysteine O-methyltransferase Ste14 [Roseovarius halotolerans]|uniref:Isoprenylcysteine carboxyl methyltransferase (ICMT) family protein n=1 Tax=Roseovarius halotolerans TaxID=505353 RepID=A0A1X6ZGF8_9RHOB|nr:isoprenylcysteine carboxylmethyltransferase family protein [Roseovarius halotolerans]RKT30860.1 protein-S-isoprenylcysteine O-methyltransferase Ste14 [Roseovarius halotolerans]SLN50622.1 hypothetical protein ROH8110_02752 [Roseovarius halotolerans]
MGKWIDLPPVWLAGFLAVAWAQSAYYPAGLGFGGAWADFAGGLLIGGGVLLMALAFFEFRRHRTTLMPHETPERLVQSGIFTRTRNPIYVGDALVLLGFILRWDAVLALPLLPVFVWVLEKRFIEPEEDRMRRKFRMDFARYCEKTRRWI